MSKSSESQTCLECGGKLEKLLSAPAVFGDYPGYECPKTGRWIEGKKAHEENLKRTGSRIKESGEHEQFLARKAAEEAAFDAAVDATIDRKLTEMGPDKVAKLCNEVASGLDVAVTRQTVGN